jgi:hypothetical protein
MAAHYPELPVVVCEQLDSNPWNKGLLFNAAYKEFGKDCDYLVLHDVDFLPVAGKVDYSFCECPTMIAGEASQFDYRLFYRDFFGGVVVLSKDHYEQVNGFSNRFKGYGGEDDHLKVSFTQKGILTKVKSGRFECFAHPRPKRSDHYRHNLSVLGAGRDFSEGLSTARYEVSSVENKGTYTHLKIITPVYE